MLGVRGSDADEPRGAGEHIWNGSAVPAVVLEVKEEDVDRRRSLSRRLEHEHVVRAAVVEEDTVAPELVAGAPKGAEEGVSARLFQETACGIEELAQGRGGDVLHEEEVGVAKCVMGQSDNAVEDRCGKYAELCDTPMQGDLGVDDAFEINF